MFHISDLYSMISFMLCPQAALCMPRSSVAREAPHPLIPLPPKSYEVGGYTSPDTPMGSKGPRYGAREPQGPLGGSHERVGSATSSVRGT